jgi:hypothetical protein
MVANTANIALLSTSEIDSLLPTPESTLTTNFNVSPYYDDFDEAKNFYRILFKPGYAVQARELTQLQTLLQKQIDRFGKHIFREGSIVIPGEFIIENDVDYVKVKDIDNSNNDVIITNFKDEILTSANTGVQAYVIEVADGSELSSSTKTVYLRYTNVTDTDKTFYTNDVLTSNVGSLIVYNTDDNIGKGSRFIIREGVYFAKEHFIKFQTQSVILNRYSTNPTCKVGFKILENIVNYTQDISLLDPALESSNYSAPGADRFQLNSVLTVLDYDDEENSPDFVELFRIKDGVVTEIFDRSQYNILGDELAKRTLDESGDYYVRGLSVRLRENLDVNDNGGLYANGNENLLSVGVEPGLAYVKGYPVELLTTKYVDVNKSYVYNNVSSQVLSSTMGSYVIANNYVGTVTHDIGTTVLLKDVAAKRIENLVWATAPSVSGNTIGTAKLKTIEYNSGTLGTKDGTVAIYLTDIKMNGTNSFVSVKSITNSSNTFGADIVTENNISVIKDLNQDVLLYSVGSKGVKTLRDLSDSPSLSYNFKRTSSVSIINGQFNITGLSAPQQFPYGTTTLSGIDKREIIFTVDSDIDITGTGTIVSNVGNVITGTSGAFTNLNAGDKIELSNNTYTYTVKTVDSSTQITLVQPSPPFIDSNTWNKVYKVGDVIDLTTKGYVSGTERAVSSTPSTLSFNLGESFTETGKVSYPVNISLGQEVQKQLRSNCYVGINTSNSAFGVTGPYPLGVSDVYRLRSIVDKSTNTDITDQFIFDNGQRDSFYDHATITPKSTLSSSLDLAVQFDYFEPNFTIGKGFFSVDSYPVNDDTYNEYTDIKTETIPIYKSPKTGVTYDLRNHIDFRPVKLNTATYVTNPLSTYTVNPSNLSAFNYDGVNLRLPVPSSQVTFDYSYYLPRRDIIVIDKNKNIFAIEGVPDVIPKTPITPDSVMLLATIYVAEYPSLATNYAKDIGREDLASVAERQSNVRFTMRDIGILKRRIENLEYYSSLNLLQKSALDLNILDDNGLNRFKNGIFVDTFSSHTFGQTDSTEYRIVVDKQEKSIRPMYTLHSFYYDYLAAESSNVQKTGNLITLPYTEALLLEQPAVTSYRNIELTSYRFVGTMTLQPDIDVWIDTQSLPDEQVRIGPTSSNLPQNTVEYNVERQHNGYIVGAPVGPGGNGKVSSNYRFGGTGTATPLDFFGRSTLQPPGWTGAAGNDQPVYSVQQVTTQQIATTYTLQEETTVEASRIVDVGITPYIRPQIIDVWGRGLLRGAKVYVFFDGEDMTAYAAPMTKAEFDKTPDERRLSSFVPNFSAPLIVNSDGNIYIALYLPTNKKFRVGQKEVVITDSPTNSIDATTYSKGYFVASGITKSIQGRVLTTASITSSVDVDVSQRNENVFLGYLDNPSCTAYSFLVKAPPEDEGLFLTSIDLFFARKHPTLGVWVEIRAMDNAGNITRTQVPYSELWKTADEIVISPDGYTNPTKFTFKSPIFLYNNVEYAFVIHTEGLNPDTYLWIARLGETDVRPTSLGGGRKYNSRPLTGTFYTTNNNMNWNMVDDIDLAIKFYRANFQTGTVGVATLGNEPVEKLIVTDPSSRFINYSEPILSYYRLSLSGNTSSISVGDYLIGATSGANSTVESIVGSVATVSNTEYVIGETLDIAYAANAISKGLTSTITNLTYGTSTLSDYSVYRGNVTIELKNSNGLYKSGEYLTGAYSNNIANITSIQNFRYSKVSFEPTYIKYKRNSLTFEMKTTSNTGIIGSYFPVYESESLYFNSEQALYSRSNEVEYLSGQKSNKVRFNLNTSSNYLSPVIDISKTRTVYEDNLINSNTTYGLEESSVGGELLNKYISKVITLADGQDAEDLNVYLTVYKPPSTNVLVWCKLLHRDDSDNIENSPWIPMELSGNEIYSSLTNREDFKEIKYVIPESYLTGPATDNSPGGEVQYTNSQGVTFTGYKYFAIKIGLAGTNSAVVPRVLDLRAIALSI